MGWENFAARRENGTEGTSSRGETSVKGKGRGRKGRKGEPMERDLKKIRDLMDLKVKQVIEKEKEIRRAYRNEKFNVRIQCER